MPTPRLAELLAAIRAAPRDDELRIVYADALEEAGELARADFIRSQLAVTREVPAGEVGDKALAGVVGEYAHDWTFVRGLVTHVDADCRVWLAHGAQMLAAAPIRSMTMRDPEAFEDDELPEIAAELAEQPWLAHLDRVAVAIYSTFGEADSTVPFFSSPHLQQITRLQVGHVQTAIDAVGCGLPMLTAVCVWSEGSSGVGDLLAALANRPDLTELDLIGCAVDGEHVRAIAAIGWRLRRLVTAGTHYYEDSVGELGLRAIANAPSLASLEVLDIESGALDDAAMRVFAASPHLRSLHTVSFFSNPITDEGASLLAKSPVLASVRNLNLTGSRVTAAGIDALRASRFARDLRIEAGHVVRQ